MKNIFRHFFFTTIFLLCVCVHAHTAEKISDFDRNRINIILFDVIKGKMNAVSQSTFDPTNPTDLISFAAYFVSNNLTYSTITSLTAKDMGQYQGHGVIPLQAVKDTVNRFFGYEMPTPAEGSYGDVQFKDGHFYIVMADGGSVEHIILKEVKLNKDGTITAQGSTFDPQEEPQERKELGTFSALLKPHVWKGMQTYAVISLSKKENK